MVKLKGLGSSKVHFKQTAIIKDSKKWIEDLKFSPNGKLLAVGSHDTKIYFYKVKKKKGSIRKYWIMTYHNAAITHLDWSKDSTYTHSNCNGYEILYSNVQARSHDTKGRTSCRDTDWATWTCTIGWDVKGIFRSEMDGSDINSVFRSNKVYGKASEQAKILATADDESEIKVYRYPCITKNSGYVGGRGHAEHVTNVKFSAGDAYLYSTGGEDQCIMQWRITRK